jgi:hypothetical protein
MSICFRDQLAENTTDSTVHIVIGLTVGLKVNTNLFVEPIAYKSHILSLYIPICLTLEFEHPFVNLQHSYQ